MQKNLQRRTGHITIWCMRISCLIIKAENTHSEYVTLIAFPLQQWLHESASVVRYTYIACLALVQIVLKYMRRSCKTFCS